MKEQIIKLKPCPFCGGGCKVYVMGLWQATCSQCHSRTAYYKTQAGAIAAWNTRIYDDDDE